MLEEKNREGTRGKKRREGEKNKSSVIRIRGDYGGKVATRRYRIQTEGI